MAYAIMGGLPVATLLTILFIPALYAAWLRLPQPDNSRTTALTSLGNLLHNAHFDF